jgi:hypothetical protein
VRKTREYPSIFLLRFQPRYSEQEYDCNIRYNVDSYGSSSSSSSGSGADDVDLALSPWLCNQGYQQSISTGLLAVLTTFYHLVPFVFLTVCRRILMSNSK